MEFITIHIFIVLLKPVCISMQSSPCCPLFLSPDTVHDYRKGTCNSPFAIRNLQNTIQHCLVKGLIYVVLLCQSDLFTTTSVNIRPIQYFGYQMCFLLKNKVILCMTLSLKSMIHDSKIITNFTGIFFYLSKNCPHGTFLTSWSRCRLIHPLPRCKYTFRLLNIAEHWHLNFNGSMFHRQWWTSAQIWCLIWLSADPLCSV